MGLFFCFFLSNLSYFVRFTHVKYDARHRRELFYMNIRQHVHQVTFSAGGETQSPGGEQCTVCRSERGYRDRQRYHPGNGSQCSDSKSLSKKKKKRKKYISLITTQRNYVRIRINVFKCFENKRSVICSNNYFFSNIPRFFSLPNNLRFCFLLCYLLCFYFY